MRPVSVFAKGPGNEIEQLRADLQGRWRQAARAVMVLLSAHGLPPAQIAELLADRPRSGRPRLGGRQLTSRIGTLLTRPGPWTLPRIRRYLGWPQVSDASAQTVWLARSDARLARRPHLVVKPGVVA